MASHRAIWAITGILAVAALMGFLFREGKYVVSTEARIREAADLRDAQINTLLEMLETDPRVRSLATRQLVEQVARYTASEDLQSAEAFYARGLYLYYWGTERFQEAEDAFRKAIELRPEWARPHNNLAVVLFELERESEAHGAWRRAMELDPQWSRPYNDMAIMYRRAGRMDDAMDSLQIALAMDPDGPVTNYNFGVLLDTLGQYGAARAQYEKVLGLNPNIAPAHYNLACNYGRHGVVDTALEYLDTAIRLNARFIEDALHDPDLDPIRHHPDFQALMRAATDSHSTSDA